MQNRDLSTHIHDPARLAALRATALLDSPTEEAYDRLSWLAVHSIKAPVALVTLIDEDRQFFKSCIGLPEPWQSLRQTPLSHSFCKHNRVAGQPLLVKDARLHPLFRDSQAIQDLHVIAYLGIPLVTSDLYVLGSFCIIDSEPRQWQQEEVNIVQNLAAAVMTEIQLRTEISARKQAEKQRDGFAELNKRLQEEIEARKQAENQQHRLEEQLFQAQKMEAIGRLAGGVAHDFNNLLSPILGYCELLSADADLNDLHKQYTDQIRRAGIHARDLVSQLLTFSRGQHLKARPCNLNETVENFEKLLRTTVPANIEIKVLLSPGIEPVMADPGQIEQILMNVAINAADAMPDGGTMAIETALCRLEKGSAGVYLEVLPGEYVMLAISDTGCGMDEETKVQIFEPFFTTKGRNGTGLGLAMVFGIVKQHGGNIRICSEPGKGTKFQIFLPVTEL